MANITKIEIEVLGANSMLAQASNIMSCLDLGIDSLGTTLAEISFETTTNVDEMYVKNLKNTLKKGFEEDGCRVDEIIVKTIV